MNVSDFVIQRLSDWDITRIYGYPGDGINGLLGALNRSDGIRFIQARHEEMAAFMACGHAKFTGEVGVCLATSGPGAIHLLNGLYDAKMDHQAVVAIVGQQVGSSLGSSYHQEVDLLNLFKDVASDYVQMVADTNQVRHVIDRAFRIAQAKRTVTVVIIPNDLQEEPAVTEPPREHGHVVSGTVHSDSQVVPTVGELQKAADILNAGERIAILVGAGAFGAANEVEEVAELLGAGVAKALLGKMVIPDDRPYVTGSIGMLGTQPSWELMNNCDTLLMIGSSFPYAEYLPQPGSARGIQIDIDDSMLSIRYPMEVNLLGGSRETLRGLIPLLKPKQDRSWCNRISGSIKQWKQKIEERAHEPADPLNPQLIFQKLSQRLPDTSIITADSGSTAFWYARNIEVKKGMQGSLSGNLATMCPSVPYAIAAKFAYPDREVFAFTGDGAMQMLCMNELITIAKYYKEWSNPRLVIIVLNNRDLNMVTWEQRMLAGEPKFDDSQNIPDVNYAAFASLLGLEGIRIDSSNQIDEAIDHLLSCNKPVVLDLLCDPNVTILPPRFDRKIFNKLNQAALKGDKEAQKMLREMIQQLMELGEE